MSPSQLQRTTPNMDLQFLHLAIRSHHVETDWIGSLCGRFHCVPLKQRDDELVDHQMDFEDDDSVTTSETQQTTHRWAAGKHSAVSRARGACALPQTVDTPEPDAK